MRCNSLVLNERVSARIDRVGDLYTLHHGNLIGLQIQDYLRVPRQNLVLKFHEN